MPRVPDLPCAVCGELLWRGTTSLPEGQATCRPCRRKSPNYRMPNQRARGVVQRWTCVECGTECQRPAMRGVVPKRCALCKRAWRRDWVPVTVRRTVYERDSWTCQICRDPVDVALIGTRSDWRPSLDHIVPRSKGGPDDIHNLRLAHLWCNAVRNDERAYTDADF